MKNTIKAIFLMSALLAGAADAVTDTFATAGTFSWTAPDGVTSVTVEAWGGGGAGGGATGTPAKGGGGAGGQYAKKVVTVVPGNTYAVVVGAGGAAGTGDGGAGGDSAFDGTAVVATGGAGGTGNATPLVPAAGGTGSIAGGIGDIVYAGGNGAGSTVDTNCNTGGGGGGGAGSTGAGGNAAGNTGGTGTAVGGGAGGTATTSSGNGAAGAAAGGGGAGACAESFTDRNGGAGGAGEVTLTYTPIGGGGAATVTASPTLCVNDTSIGSRPWGTLTGPFASDDAYATASVGDNQTTNYLKCTGYGFAIPADATIVGITVNVERKASNTLVRDFAMRIVQNGVIDTTVNYATATNYITTDVIEPHGGAADLWGLAWTPTDINSPDFGTALASRKNGTSGGARTVSVDHMPITIDYILPPVPVAEYRMDEANWNGTPNEVADSSGNALHGSALLGATTAAAKICNGANLAANYAEVPDHALLDITTALTVTAWIKPARWGGAPGDALMTILSKDTNYEAHVTDTGTINWWWGTGNITSAATAPVGVWTHVAMVYANGSQTLYINGVASATGTVAGALPINAMPFQIGNDQEFGGGTRRFDGMIDEVKIFNRALSPARVLAIYTNENAGNNWDGTARTCPVTVPDHLEIQHVSGTGVTCTPSTLTIKACTDAAVPCVTPYTAGVSGTLGATGTGMTVNWDGTTGGATGAGFDISPGGSSVTKDVQVTTPGTVTFGIASVTPVPANAATCNFGANAPANDNCVFTASDAGFLVSAPNHVAETASALTVQAVKKADNSLACVPAFAGAKTVNLKCAYVNPATGTLPARVGGAALNAANDAAAACDGTGRNISLNFDATGVATPTLRYADVGEMRIDASFSGTAGTIDAGLVMTGSGTFIAAPASFAFSGITAGPIKAGNAFSATVTARNSIGATTPNFGKEAPTAEGVTLASSLVTPDPGTFPTANNPAPGNNVIAGTEFGAGGMVSDANGVATVNNLSWGEVGSITLTANLTSGDYLASGVASASGTSVTVGAFIPDHLDTAVVATATTPMPCPPGLNCPVLYNGFVYSGQPFSVQVTARNLANGTTLNYDGPFGLSNDVTLSVWDALGSTTTQNPGPGALANNTLAAAAFAAGIGTTVTPTYTFSATPTAPTNIFVRAVDAVNATVTSLRATPASSVEGGVMVASGRIKIGNAHGSELLRLPMTATVQYYNATNWVNSVTDSVTSLTLGVSNYQCKTGCAWTTALTPATGTLAAGVLNFSLSKPTGGGTGSVDVSASAPSYLLSGSNGAAVNPSNTARATFGVYKGNNEFIYMREVY